MDDDILDYQIKREILKIQPSSGIYAAGMIGYTASYPRSPSEEVLAFEADFGEEMQIISLNLYANYVRIELDDEVVLESKNTTPTGQGNYGMFYFVDRNYIEFDSTRTTFDSISYYIPSASEANPSGVEGAITYAKTEFAGAGGSSFWFSSDTDFSYLNPGGKMWAFLNQLNCSKIKVFVKTSSSSSNRINLVTKRSDAKWV